MFSQRYGMEHLDVFFPFAQCSSLRMLFPLLAQRKWDIIVLDIKKASSNGNLSEELYMEHPKNFVKMGGKNMVYHFWKATDGLLLGKASPGTILKKCPERSRIC